MRDKVKVYVQNTRNLIPVNFKVIKFSDGSVNVVLDKNKSEYLEPLNGDDFCLIVNLYATSLDDLMVVLQIASIFNVSEDNVTIKHYSPLYTRYDRRMYPYGRDAIGLEHYAKFAKMIAKNHVFFDAHNEEAIKSYFSNCCVNFISSLNLTSFDVENLKRIVLVSPDKGALLKTQMLASTYNLPVLVCQKDRNPTDGELLGFKVSHLDCSFTSNTQLPKNPIFYIRDDICERGGTFLGVKSVVEEWYGADDTIFASYYLHVTHGVFPERSLSNMLDNFSKVIVNFTNDEVIASLSYNRPNLVVGDVFKRNYNS